MVKRTFPRPQLVVLLLTLGWLLGAALVQAQTATPTPTPTPAPTEPPAILLIQPTATPTPVPQGTPAEQFWAAYQPIIIAGLVTGIVGIIVGVFLTSIAETIKGWLGRLFHWLFDRIASSVLVRWRYDKVYRQTLANSLLALRGGEIVDRPMSLEKMYVPALLTEDVHPDLKEGVISYATQDQIQRQQLAHKVGSWEAVQRFHRFVVLGGPGVGKTTYLHHLAYHCALRRRPELKEYLPIFIRFRDYIGQLNKLERLETIFPVVLADNNFPNADRFVEQQLQAGRCLILLDGLDEVPSEDDHKRMIALVQGFANRYLQEKQPQGRNILVVSSRKYNYDHQQKLNGFPTTEVMEFDNDTIERFVHNWFEGEYNHWADELMTALRGNRRFLELARNPLLLLLIAHHYQRDRNLPRQRADLYRRCVGTRIIRWNETRGAHHGRFGETDKVRLLRSLALHIMQHEETGLLWRPALLERVEEFAQLLRLPDGTTSAQLLEEVVNASGLIQEWAIDRYGFSHQTLQEFFAAEAIDRLGSIDGANLLADYLHNSAWHEIVLLYAGLVDNASSLLGKLLQQAVALEPEFDLWLLAGQCLAEGAKQVPHGARYAVAEKLVSLLHTDSLPAKARGEVIVNCQLFAPDLLPGLVAPLLARGAAADLFLAAELVAPLDEAALKNSLSQQLLPLAGAVAEGTRQAALVALGRLGVAAVAGTTLLARLQDSDATTRAEAARGLGRLGAADEATTAALVQLYEQEQVDAPRHAALQALLVLGQAAAVGMEPIAAGEFLLGSLKDDRQADADEKPQHSVYLPAYFMDRTPVTNRQYRRFMVAGGYGNPAYWKEAMAAGRWQDGAYLDYYNNNKPTTEPPYWQDAKWNGDEQPVVGVSWYEALAYGRWAGKRLPTEAEWEKGASWERGSRGAGEQGSGGAEGQGSRGAGVKRRYPWGDEWREGVANTEEAGKGQTTAVGSYSPQGDSAYGLVDMAGNVWEWCSTSYKPYPYTPDDGREDLSGGDDVVRVVRGGSWYNDQKLSRCAVRFRLNPWSGHYSGGFRCCATDSLSKTGSES